MVKLIFTTHLHPNEHVAAEMANLVAARLRHEGRQVEIVDLGVKRNWAKEMSRNNMVRTKLLLEAMGKHRDGNFFDFHDSPIEGLQKQYGTSTPTLELTQAGYYLVETPAVYVSQEDPEVSRHAEGERTLNRYFTQKSDVLSSREAGLLSGEQVDLLAGKILDVAKRYV